MRKLFFRSSRIRSKSALVRRLFHAGILLEPGIVFVAEIDGAAQPVQRLAGVAVDGEVGGEPVSHFAVGLGGGKRVVFEQGSAALSRACLHIADGQRRHGNAQRGIVGDHALENFDGLVEISHPHLLIARRRAQQRMPRLQRQAFFKLIAGQLDLILIVVHAGAMVIENRRVGRIQFECAAEFGQCLVVHAVAAQRQASDHVHIPVIRGAGEQVGDAVARRLLFAARQQHINAVEIGFGRSRIELERLIEGAPRVASHESARRIRGAHIATRQCPVRSIPRRIPDRLR